MIFSFYQHDSETRLAGLVQTLVDRCAFYALEVLETIKTGIPQGRCIP